MKIDSKQFRVRPGKKFKIKEWPTSVKPFYTPRRSTKNSWTRMSTN